MDAEKKRNIALRVARAVVCVLFRLLFPRNGDDSHSYSKGKQSEKTE